ncbi:MAG: hypothetical protein DMG57_32550 [Acidobacteria bacterium]|nr:MAG: hypothetical protein DMG57_32550 [Acidobacteriota bacterium]
MVPATVTVSNPRRGKNLQIVGVLLILLGLTTCAIGMRSGSRGEPSDNFGHFLIGLLSFFAGATLWIIGRLIHWYHAE